MNFWVQIPKPEPLTSACTWVAAIFIAIREGAKDTETLPSLVHAMSGTLSYLPISVLAVAAAVNLINLTLRRDGRDIEAPKVPVSAFSPPAPQVSITPTTPISKSKTEASVVAVPPPPGDDRIYVEPSVTADTLRVHFKEHTAVTADRIVAPYLGKWMSVDGVAWDVSTGYKNTRFVKFKDLEFDVFDTTDSRYFLQFRTEYWANRLDLLAKGTKIKAVGNIVEINSNGVQLDDCELV